MDELDIIIPDTIAAIEKIANRLVTVQAEKETKETKETEVKKEKTNKKHFGAVEIPDPFYLK